MRIYLVVVSLLCSCSCSCCSCSCSCCGCCCCCCCCRCCCCCCCVAVVVEVRVVKLVKLVKLSSVYFFDIFTSKKAQNPQFFTLLTSKCASCHNGVHFFDTFSTSEPPKVVRTPSVFNILTWKCASRHNGVHFFNISTSKSGPTTGVFCTFWLQNVLRATTACTFSTSQLPKVVRPWCVLYILTSKCASRHNGVHFFDISTSKSGPILVVFCPFWLGNVLRATTACTFSCLIWPAGSAPAALASLLFDPPEPQIIGKTQWIATFLPFRASASSFFWSFLFWLFSPLLFNCPYCRKFHF